MRKWFLLLWVLICCCWLAGCPGGESIDTPSPGGNPTEEIQEMLNRHNNTRTSLGLSTLASESHLNNIAQAHAEWMLSTGNLSHTDGDGHDVGDRATAAGYSWTTVGENIAYAGSAETAYTLWLGSSGHYANITNSNFTEVGIGLAETANVQYWCVVFGAR